MVKVVHVRNPFYLSRIETTLFIIQFCELVSAKVVTFYSWFGSIKIKFVAWFNLRER